MRTLFFGLALGVLAPSSAFAANLVANGDFSAGATGFTSTYSTTVSGATANQGSYAVVTNPALLCSTCFPSIGDHTTGTGNMLFLDGAGTNAGAFWSQTVSVSAGTSYALSLWATSVNQQSNRAILRAVINGLTVFGPTQLNYTTGVTATTWLNYSGVWASGGATSATIELFDDLHIYDYNDFAIDDISLTELAAAAVPEPSSWTLMIGGLGLVGGALRRRAKAVAFA
jgi:hypothetical protein